MRRLETVVAPPIHEGVGNALRRAYFATVQELPRELAALLARIG